MDLLGPYHTHKVDGARVVMASMFAAFLKHCQNQSEDLIDGMVAMLMGGLADSNITVRKVRVFSFFLDLLMILSSYFQLCVRGMGNVAHCTDAVLTKYIPSVLSAMIAGLEDNLDHKGKL